MSPFFVLQKRPATEFIDPLANKKPRISHMVSKAPTPINGKLSSSNGKEASSGPSHQTTLPSHQMTLSSLGESGASNSQPPLDLPKLDLPRPFDPLSDVSNDSSHNGRDGEVREAAVAERLAQPAPQPLSGPASSLHPPAPRTLSPPLDPARAHAKPPSPTPHGKSKKKSKKHKDKDKTKDKERDREREGRKERRGGEERVAEQRVVEQRKACEISSSPETMKAGSGPHKSTGMHLYRNLHFTIENPIVKYKTHRHLYPYTYFFLQCPVTCILFSLAMNFVSSFVKQLIVLF